MALYLVTSSFSANDNFSDLKSRASAIKAEVRSKCTGLKSSQSYFLEDAAKAIDIVSAKSRDQLDKAVDIIRKHGKVTVEVEQIRPWRDFVDGL